MRFKILLILSVFWGAASLTAQANDFEFSLGEEVMQFSYLTRSSLLGSEKQDLNFGILLTENREIVGSAGFLVPVLPVNSFPKWLSFAVGARGYFTLLTEPQDADTFSLSPGLECRLTIPIKIPMHLTGSAYYSPRILTFGDAKDMYDLMARYEVGFTRSAIGFVGYRRLRYDLESVDFRDVDDDWHIGVRVAF